MLETPTLYFLERPSVADYSSEVFGAEDAIEALAGTFHAFLVPPVYPFA